jgi:hypothetical protein
VHGVPGAAGEHDLLVPQHDSAVFRDVGQRRQCGGGSTLGGVRGGDCRAAGGGPLCCGYAPGCAYPPGC